MSIDYFGTGYGDCSNWFASMTQISGAINGTVAAYSFYMSQQTQLPDENRICGYLLWNHIPYLSLLLNVLFGCKSTLSLGDKTESRIREIRTGNTICENDVLLEERLFEIKKRYGGMPDPGLETFGLTKRSDESCF